ncbi:hypothetical protein [Aeromonas sp.]|uniref:hypothetical protein n=1 Tax=Aeromonas sp. TaxID=647 RepID=UPI00258415DD|nr:hypothetical protein [Aeromonas sp.]MCX7128070.1 hypothetical protein [Aeromonas sp.]
MTTYMTYTQEQQMRINYFSNNLIELNLELLKQQWYAEKKFTQEVIQYRSELNR